MLVRPGQGGQVCLVPAPELTDLPLCALGQVVGRRVRHRRCGIFVALRGWRVSKGLRPHCVVLEGHWLRAIVPYACSTGNDSHGSGRHPCGQDYSLGQGLPALVGNSLQASALAGGPLCQIYAGHSCRKKQQSGKQTLQWRMCQDVGVGDGCHGKWYWLCWPEGAVAEDILSPLWPGKFADRDVWRRTSTCVMKVAWARW